MPRMAHHVTGSRPWAKPACEILEGRILLAADLLGLPGAVPAAPARHLLAFENALQQLADPPPVGHSSSRLAADLDGDGLEDLVELSGSEDGGSTLEIRRGLAEGGHLADLRLALATPLGRLLCGDFDGDGRADLFLGRPEPGQGTLLLGRSDGAFDVFRRAEPHVALAVADLDGDGQDDFVYAHAALDRLLVEMSASGPGVLAGGEMGLFDPAALHLVDLDGDGALDLLVCNGGAPGLLIFPGLGDGQFGPALGSVQLPPGVTPAQLAFAHLADDLRQPTPALDLVVASEATSEVLVYHNHGGLDLQLGLRLPVGRGPTSVLARDATGDGKTDLIVTASADNTVWILPGNGDGTFATDQSRILPTGSRPVATFLADFDGDRLTDLVTLDRGSSTLTYYSNIASPTAQPLRLPSGGAGPIAGLLRDVNSDGRTDLVVANHEDGWLTLFEGGADGLTATRSLLSPGGQPTALAGGTPALAPWQFYVVHEGSASAMVVGFEPDAEEPGELPTFGSGPMAPEEPPSLSPGPMRAETQLQPLTPTSIDLIPTLVLTLPAVTEDLPDPTLPGGGGKEPRDSSPASGGGGEADAGDPEEEVVEATEEALRAQRFLLGVDDVAAPVVLPDGSTQSEQAEDAPALPEVVMTAPPPPREEEEEPLPRLPLEQAGEEPAGEPVVAAVEDEGELSRSSERTVRYTPEVMVVLAACGLGREYRRRQQRTARRRRRRSSS